MASLTCVTQYIHKFKLRKEKERVPVTFYPVSFLFKLNDCSVFGNMFTNLNVRLLLEAASFTSHDPPYKDNSLDHYFLTNKLRDNPQKGSAIHQTATLFLVAFKLPSRDLEPTTRFFKKV